MGYGPLVRAATGLTEAWRYADDPDSFSDSITIYPDHVAARIGAIAAVALLIRRERTGRGGHASIAQAEVMLAQFGREMALASRNKSARSESSAVYQCSGDDEWIVLTERDEADASAISSVCSGRAVSEWMASSDADEAVRRLQAAGVPAARMLRVADLPQTGYFADRGLLRSERHPFLVESVTSEARQSQGRRLATPPTRPAPLMGEHSDEIMREWLAIDPAAVEQLASSGVIERACAEERRAIEEVLAATTSRNRTS
jgi:crotonobetainyl-CoA:carnitine CoA-transferase CaiB-like acyl-CoA transferase